MNCICGSEIPTERQKLGFKQCVSCSSQEKYGYVNITNHKTGNTIQVVSQEQAALIRKVGDRKRFGTILKGGSKNDTYNPKNIKYGCSTSFVGSDANFEEVGRRVMIEFENSGKQAAYDLIDHEVTKLNINKYQGTKIKRIIDVLP